MYCMHIYIDRYITCTCVFVQNARCLLFNEKIIYLPICTVSFKGIFHKHNAFVLTFF